MDKKKRKNSLVKETIKQIRQDCIKLKKRNDLTEYGEGQLDLSNIVLKKSKD